MKLLFTSIVLFVATFCSISNAQIVNLTDSITKIEMHLSAFGVEADDFPSIDVMIDFKKRTGICKKSYYNPAYESSTYELTTEELDEILALYQFKKLEIRERDNGLMISDQPTSVTKITTTKNEFSFEDYGLVEPAFKELYQIVYKLN